MYNSNCEALQIKKKRGQKVMKKILSAALAISIGISGITPLSGENAQAKTKTTEVHKISKQFIKERKDYTLKEAESLYRDFLKSKNINNKIGSEEFTKYALNQFYSDETDKDLLDNPQYGVIMAYISEYVYAYEKTVGNIKNGDTINTSPSKFTNNVNTVISDKTSNINVINDIKVDEAKIELNKKLEIQKEKTIGEIEDEIADEENQSQIKSNKLSTLASSYSVSDAKAYAKKWYDGRNSHYDSYDNDCTNFTSQILYYAGKKMKSPSSVRDRLYDDTSYWFYTTITRVGQPLSARSTSWTVVSDFYAFWSKTQDTKASTSKSTLISYADVGDMIQFKKEDATRYSHTMFIYDKGDGTLYLSGHTDNYLKKNFKNISSKWTKYRVIKF